MDVRTLLGRNTARIRKGQGLSQEQLAEAAGVSQQYLSGIERGSRNPTLIILKRLADALKVDIGTLIQELDTAD
jgi:transcriptional regulator with XRE-family HTH domain